MSARQPRRPGLWRAFWRSRRGATALEFALIAPVLIVMYCGMAELTEAMMAQRRLSGLTSAIGDLVAQGTQTGPTKTTDIFNIGKTIMAPFSTTNLTMCIASITSDANGKDTVAWSQASATMATCPAANAVLTDISTAVLPASQSVIMARATYIYASPIKLVMPTNLTFTRTYYLRPRKTDAVLWNTAS